MKRYIFLLIFTFLQLFGNENLKEIVEKVTSINAQFLTLENNEGNTTHINQEFKSISNQKQQLISQTLGHITSSSFMPSFNEKAFEQAIKNLKKELSTTKDQEQIALLNLELSKTNATYKFYKAINALHNSHKSLFAKDFSNNIEKSLLAIKSIKLPDKALLHSNQENSKKYIKTQSTIQAYDEILSYIKNNLTFFQSSYIFEKLDFNTIINHINTIIPISNSYLNLGKVFICFLIFSFFWLVRSMLKKRTFTIFVFPVQTRNYAPKTKASIIKSTNKPLLFLLPLIATDLSISILYQPNIVPEKLNIFISVIYIMACAWLIMGIINGYSIALLSYLAQKESVENFRKEAINFIIKILFSIVIIIALLASFHKMGFDISAVLASLGIGGLAVAFAAKDILANFFSSIMLLFDNSFSQGDWIKCGDTEGTVIEIGMRRTTIRTFDNAMLFVPNSKLASEVVRNWNRRRVGRRIKMHIGLTYDSPREKIELCVNDIKEMLLNHPQIAKPTDTHIHPQDRSQSFKDHIVSVNDLRGYKRTLLVYLDQFSSSSIDILVYCFSQSAAWEDWLATKQDVLYKIMDIVHGHGLSFAFPSQSLYLENLSKELSKEEFVQHHMSKD